MYSTEEEAKTKWCPMVRSIVLGPSNQFLGIGANADYHHRGDQTNQCSRCIGSNCMMWRSHSNPQYGYCGLAGKPPYPGE